MWIKCGGVKSIEEIPLFLPDKLKHNERVENTALRHRLLLENLITYTMENRLFIIEHLIQDSHSFSLSLHKVSDELRATACAVLRRAVSREYL